MSPALVRWANGPFQAVGFAILMGLHIALDHWAKDSAAANVIKWVYLLYVPFWLSIRIRIGYLRRKPYWTRASWLRYLRLVVMPVIALILVLWISSFDMSLNWGVLGGPGSPTRAVWTAILLGMMLLGVVGLIRAVDWLVKGEPSDQFTRTRWFQRRARAS